jgi:hypothetical protein
MAEIRPVEPTGEDLQNPPGTDNGTDVPAAVDTPLAAPDSSVAEAAPVEAAPTATSEVQPASVASAPVASAPVAPVASAPVAPAPAAAAQQVVYVQAPKPFLAKGNRGFGILIAILSAIIFTALNAAAEIIFELVNGQPIDVSFLTTTGFYAPTVMFAVGFILLVLVVNRAGWAAHVLGSLFVGLVVFFGGTGLLLLLNISSIPSNEVADAFTRTLFSPELIIAGLLGREVSLWMGAAIASRGRKVKARNVDAKVLYDQEIAAKRAEYEQANAAAVATPAPVVAEPVVAEPVAAEPVATETPAP